MTNSDTDARTEADYATAAQWAERDLPDAPPGRSVLRGAAAAAAGRADLENALGGPDALDRALGGRPPLDPTAPVGQHAPKRQFRLTPDLDAQLDALAHAQDRNASDVLRDALTAYVATHPIAS